MNDIRKLYSLKEMLCEELKEYADRGKLDAATLEVVDKLSHAIKNLCKIIESFEMEESGYSNTMMPQMPMRSFNSYDGGSYAPPTYMRGRGPAARRDSMGRYSSRGEDFRMDMQELIAEAPNEAVRQKMMDIVNSI